MSWSPCLRCRGQSYLEPEHPFDPADVPHVWTCVQCGSQRAESNEEVVQRAGSSRAQAVAVIHAEVRRELEAEIAESVERMRRRGLRPGGPRRVGAA